MIEKIGFAGPAGADDGKDRTGVFTSDGGTVAFRTVATGLIGGLDIEISGVAEGAPVVVGPFQALRDLVDGQKVRRKVRQ